MSRLQRSKRHSAGNSPNGHSGSGGRRDGTAARRSLAYAGDLASDSQSVGCLLRGKEKLCELLIFVMERGTIPRTTPTFFNSLLQAARIAGEQDSSYDSGVGTGGDPIDKLLGGALGAGLVVKIKAGYTRIAHVYEAGDDIFLFGFSRGAFTARSLAGMIAICGLPTENVDEECVDSAFEAYRNQADRQMLLDSLKEYSMEDARFKMLGVWDTVGSLGIPAAWGGIDAIQYGFLDTSLHPDVLDAYQALAIDEQRAQFPPTPVERSVRIFADG